MSRDDWFTSALSRRVDTIVQQMGSTQIGSAWWAPPAPRLTRAVVFATSSPDETARLLQAALTRFSARATTLVCGLHRAMGRQAERLGVTIIVGPINPWPLIEAADCVFAAARSEAALLASILGKDLGHCIADPLRLAAATLLLGTRYINPFTKRPVDCEIFLDIISEMRRSFRTSGTITCCVGISIWKRRRVAETLTARGQIAFRRTARSAVSVAARRGGAIAVWPSRAPAALEPGAREAGIPIFQLEDGFVRSVGLGADFRPPLSLVLDQSGLYYDATRPSDLEALLADTVFTPALLRRSAALRLRIVRERVTKYNLSSTSEADLPRVGRLILVPGQVADDRSVLRGGAGVGPGLDLLRRVRQQAPEAYIVYKPHPDVDAGHRAGAIADSKVLELADRVVRSTSMADLLAQVDEVHTLTSLTGFEALLRGKSVTTYGQPFYAGWGLTTDLNPPTRRTRRLELNELVAGTLILYPRYFDPQTALLCGPETVLDRLRDPALHRPTLLIRARSAQGRLAEQWRRLKSTRVRKADV